MLGPRHKPSHRDATEMRLLSQSTPVQSTHAGCEKMEWLCAGARAATRHAHLHHVSSTVAIIDWSPDHIPQSPPEDERLASLSSDGPHCGLRTDGTPVCWTKYVDSGLTSPPEGEGFTTISASPRHACALREEGEVVCWGQNWFGQASPPDGKMWIDAP